MLGLIYEIYIYIIHEITIKILFIYSDETPEYSFDTLLTKFFINAIVSFLSDRKKWGSFILCSSP